MRHKDTFLYGMVAEFASPEALLNATEQAKERGYSKLDCYTPYPVHGLSEAMRIKDFQTPWAFFVAGLVGGLSGLALEWYVSSIDYPINVGGKPLFSLPSFVPVAYECTILFSALGGVLFMLGRNGLPQPYHPIFNAPDFERASQDRFFLCLEASDPIYDSEGTHAFLETLSPLSVSVVEGEE